jgi:serine/threonine protein kinase
MDPPQATRRPEAQPTARLVAGRYRLRALLGRGGMGRVWLAEDELLCRPVALKEVLLNGPKSEETRVAAWACALGEARAAGQIQHGGAVGIYDLVTEDNSPWIVMEPLWGRTLEEELDAEGPLSIGRVAMVGLRLLDVLQATHRAGIVHRDVKPGNVHLGDSGRVVLLDFGIACPIGDDFGAPGGAFVGSAGYIAPERVNGEPAQPASDLFSLGATLFVAVEGSKPFDRGSVFATLTAVVEDPAAECVRAGPLRPVIEGLLAKDADRRLDADRARAALRAVERRHSDRRLHAELKSA